LSHSHHGDNGKQEIKKLKSLGVPNYYESYY
jgi:hypothetical protein